MVIASHCSSLPTTMKDSAKKATLMSTDASHINLFTIATICFLARLSITTTDVWTTTTAREINSASESTTKKTIKAVLCEIFASPSCNPGARLSDVTY